MRESLDKALSAAILTLLRPLVRILLRNGIAYGTFAELAKKVYVDVAFEEFPTPGRKQTISRVSALTGLTRKEAKRLLELENPDDQGANERYNRAVRVISGWLNDARFHDEEGQPAVLPLEDGNPSFADLVRKYSGDIPPHAMLLILSDAGSVQREDDRVRLVAKAYIPGGDPVDKINILGTDSAELIATIDHNLTAPEDRLWFQRKVSDARVDPAALPRFRALAGDKAQALLEELDQWLARHECGGNDGDEAGAYVSMGIYYHEHRRDE
ncbi:MAG TPA: hypothetical protein ENK48_00345 [Gammaproteobacteria bacterium]|nr:hypothetical protein [Gammaproteobacteria bacterium]